MPNDRNTISRYQMLCLGFVGLLSPIIRLLPSQAVALAGPQAWFSVLLSLAPMALLFFLMERFLRYALPGEGFGQLMLRCLGKWPGLVLLALVTLWLVFYTGFALRSAADRYVTSAYTSSSPAVFMVVLLAISLAPVLGRFKSLGRTAEGLLPLLALVLLLVFGFSFQDVEGRFLPPLSAGSPGGILSAVPVISNVLALSVYIGFMEGRISGKQSRKKTLVVFLFLMTACVVLLCVTTVGCFGGVLTTRLSYPFFIMIRNISILDFLERLEAVVLALWVATDFIMVSTLLFIIVNNLRLCFGLVPHAAEERRAFDLSQGRWLIWLAGAAVLTAGLVMAPQAAQLEALSHRIVPYANLAVTFGLLPLVAIIGFVRKKV